MPRENQEEEKIKTNQHGLSLDVLWIVVVLCGFLFFVSLIPLPPNDFWWHLKIGEYIFSNHMIPTTNMYGWTLPAGQPFFYGAWLAELLFYILYRLGSLSLIIAMRTLLIGITFWMVAAETRRRSHSWRISALVIAMLALMITNNLPVRTQMWAWLPFVITYIILKRFTEGNLRWPWLIVCPLSMMVWVNVHGSYILGIIILGAFFGGEIISKWLKQAGALDWKQIGAIGATGILSTLAILVNPRGFGIVGYTINLLTNPPSQQLIEEWQSPTPQGLANIVFFLSIIVFIVVLAVSKYRLSPTEIILLAGFLWLAWSGQRYVLWYGIISTPILGRMIREIPLRMPAWTPQKNWLNAILACVLFIPVILVQPWMVKRLPLPKTYRQQVLMDSAAGPLLSVGTPVLAAEYLIAHPGGHLFNEMGYGSYLIWADPDQGVFVDPRVELYPYDQWLDYISISKGIRYDEILNRYGVDRILLEKNLQPELASLLPEDNLWKLEYEDPYSEIWARMAVP